MVSSAGLLKLSGMLKKERTDSKERLGFIVNDEHEWRRFSPTATLPLE